MNANEIKAVNFFSEFLSALHIFISMDESPALNKFKLSAGDLDLSSLEGLEGVYLFRILAVRS